MNRQAQSDIARKKRIFSHAEETGNIAKTCRYFGISRETFYDWKKRYAARGDEGLINSKPCPQNPKLRVPKEIEEKILYLRTNYHFGPARIAWSLERYFGMKVSSTGVYHVLKRHTSRWNLPKDAIKTYATLMMCLRGSVCLYQGEELGLPEADVQFEDLQDPYGIEFWPQFKGRDGCRTPMVWNTQDKYAGFGSAKPWLPISLTQAEMAADRQENDPESVLNHYRRAIRLRQENPALSTGQMIEMTTDNNVLSFIRKSQIQTIFCAFNLTHETVQITLPDGHWQSIATRLGAVDICSANKIEMAPWQYCIVVKQV